MSSDIKMDLTSENLEIRVGDNIEIKSKYSDEKIIMDMVQFELLSEQYYSLVNEPTRDEMRDKVMHLENKVEELENIIEIKEENETIIKERKQRDGRKKECFQKQ